MPGRLSVGPIQFRVKSASASQQEPSEEGEPFRILLLAGFGAASPTAPVRVDLDNLETIFAQFSARPTVQTDGGLVELAPKSLEDIHPDALVKLPLFGRLRDLRSRLAAASTFAAALPELHSLQGPAAPAKPAPVPGATSAPAAQPKAAAESDDDMIQRLLGRPRAATAPAPAATAAQDIIRAAVQTSIATVSAVDQESALRAVDELISGTMRSLLHAPAFQALESAWRSVEWMARRLELGDELELWIANVPRESLAAVATDGRLAQWLKPGFNIVTGAFHFGRNAEDAGLLQRIGQAAAAGNALFVSSFALEENRAITLSETPCPEWDDARADGAAGNVRLIAPRFLLRRPYGKDSDPIDSFEFEEMSAPPRREDYLWGNAAVLHTCQLAERNQQTGEAPAEGGRARMSELPVHLFRQADGPAMNGPAEFWLNDGEAEHLVAAGISTAQPVRGSDSLLITAVPFGA